MDDNDATAIPGSMDEGDIIPLPKERIVPVWIEGDY